MIRKGRWTLIEPRRENIEYYADHRDGLWYLRVNDTARTFRLVTAPVATPGRAHWRELMAHREDVMLEDLELFQSFAVVVERANGLPQMRVMSFDKQGAFAEDSRQIAFPEPTYIGPSPREPRIRNRQVSLWVSVPGLAYFGV